MELLIFGTAHRLNAEILESAELLGWNLVLVEEFSPDAPDQMKTIRYSEIEGNMEAPVFVTASPYVPGHSQSSLRYRQHRSELWNEVARRGFSNWITLRHPSSWVSATTTVGGSSYVGPNASISTNTSLGVCARVGRNASIGHEVEIGDFCSVGPGATVVGGVRIHDSASVGPGAVVLNGVVIGPDSFVAAGSVVTKDVPAGALVMGNPARIREPRG